MTPRQLQTLNPLQQEQLLQSRPPFIQRNREGLHGEKEDEWSSVNFPLKDESALYDEYDFLNPEKWNSTDRKEG